MRRITTLVTAVALAAGMLAAAPAAHACVGVRCQVECLKSTIENFPRPNVCPD